jgi:hypothetical protein
MPSNARAGYRPGYQKINKSENSVGISLSFRNITSFGWEKFHYIMCPPDTPKKKFLHYVILSQIRRRRRPVSPSTHANFPIQVLGTYLGSLKKTQKLFGRRTLGVA